MIFEVGSLGAAVDDDGGIIQTGPFGSQLKQSEYSDEGIPVIMPRDIRNGQVDPVTVARVSEATANRLARHKIEINGIVLPRRGDIAKRAFIGEQQAGWLCGTGCIKIETKGKRVWPKYLYYLLGTPESIGWLENNAVGSTMLNLSTEIVARFPVQLPAIDTQKEIAAALSAYDDLIENNRQRIALLEESARLLYREWFVHLRFPGHERINLIEGIPEGWDRCEVGSLLELHYGKALKQDDRIAGSVPVYGSSGVVGSHQTALVQGPTIIVGRKGNVGNVYWSHDACWPIDTVFFVPTERVDLWLYLALPSAGFQNTDAGVPGLNRDFAYSRRLLRPDMDVRRHFNELVGPMFSQRTTLEDYNRKLANARDLLLPRLMNGEITV